MAGAWPQGESETVELKTSLADLRRGNVSHRRNPLIADLFRRIDMVEAWGRGMPLILENAPSVEFREIARLFVASFERPSAALETGPENATETPEKHQRNTKELLLQALQEQPGLTVKALALAMHLSDASVRHHLRVLQAEKKLRHVGPTKSGRWEVSEPDPKGKT